MEKGFKTVDSLKSLVEGKQTDLTVVKGCILETGLSAVMAVSHGSAEAMRKGEMVFDSIFYVKGDKDKYPIEMPQTSEFIKDFSKSFTKRGVDYLKKEA